MKAISVIIPVYNTGKLLRVCFESILAQTVARNMYEVIAVDDGSTDQETIGILNEYRDKYPDVFQVFRKENGGQGSARNLAFKHCTSEYFTCLDSDDAFEKDWMEKMYGAAKEKNADFVGCGYKAVRYEQEKKVVVRELDMRPICKNNREMFIDANVSMFTTLVKNSVLKDSGASYPEGLIYEDTAFFLELLPWIKNPVYISEALSIRTLHGGSTMTNADAFRVANIFPVFEALIAFYNEKKLYDEYRNELEYMIGKVLLCSSANRIGFVKSFFERRKLARRTMDFLKTNLPFFRRNPYIKDGLKGFYLRNYNGFLLNILIEALRIRFKIKKDYNT